MTYKTLLLLVLSLGLIATAIFYLNKVNSSLPSIANSPAPQQLGLPNTATLGEIKQINNREYIFPATNEPVETGDKQTLSGEQTSTSQPFAKLNRWGGETYLQVGYQQNEPMTAKVEDGKLKWQGKKQEVHFYTIKDNSQNKLPLKTTFNFQDFFFWKFFFPVKSAYAKQDSLRYLNLGRLDPPAMSASYEFLQEKVPQTPTLIAYQPKEDTYVFYGYKQSERDLYSNKVNMPMTRYKTVADKECPVIYAEANKGFIFTLYHPEISQKPSDYINLALSTINKSLKKYGIEVKDIHHLLYYQDGLVPKQLGRMDTDGNYLIFYLYPDSPLEKEDFVKATRPFVFRDGKLMPLVGLHNIDKNIDASLMDDIGKSFAKELKMDFTSDNLTAGETQIMNNLKTTVSSDAWIKEAKRNGISARPESGTNPDKFEVELILKEKPDVNVFNFNIETKGLKFYYQPELTEEEKDRGGYRPEDVIGSYAVYYDREDKFLKTADEANKYQTGKAFHIYRPKITDKTGNWIWGSLNMNEEKGILTVTVPQNFLNQAVYPVNIDPTFGYTTIGATQQGFTASTFIGSLFTTTETGTLSSITAYITPGSDSREFGIYKHANSALLAQTSTDTTDYGSSSAWVTLNISGTIVTKTDYVLGAVLQTAPKNSAINYDTGSANQGHTGTITSYPTFDNPITFSSHDTNKYSIYATYTASSSSVQLQGLQMKGIQIK